MRYRIRGLTCDSSGELELEQVVYVDADTPDAAVRKRTFSPWLRIDEVIEVPADEGRGPIWRLLRWLRKPAAK